MNKTFDWIEWRERKLEKIKEQRIKVNPQEICSICDKDISNGEHHWLCQCCYDWFKGV